MRLRACWSCPPSSRGPRRSSLRVISRRDGPGPPRWCPAAALERVPPPRIKYSIGGLEGVRENQPQSKNMKDDPAGRRPETTMKSIPPEPLTLEGSYILHQMIRVRWPQWKACDPNRRTNEVAAA